MAIKYRIAYNDVEGNEYDITIESDSYSGLEVPVGGKARLQLPETKVLDPIKGAALRLELDADSGQDFSDLYTEEERVWLVRMTRNTNLTLFVGWVDPEGVFEDYVQQEWVISLDVNGGLGLLKNLRFVDDNGFPFYGRQSALQIIANCLARTELGLRIRSAVDIYPVGFSIGSGALRNDPLANIYFNVDRYVRDDGETIQDCHEVLSSVLKVFGAVITQENARWIIYRPESALEFNQLTFLEYEPDGTAVPAAFGGGQARFPKNFRIQTGSFSAGHTPHLCNENQQIFRKKSLASFRVNYKHGLDESLVNNPYFKSLDGSTYPSWQIVDPGFVEIPDDRLGVRINGGNNTNVLAVQSTDPISVATGDTFVLTLKWKTSFRIAAFVGLVIEVQLGGQYLTLVDPENVLFNEFQGQWGGTPGNIILAGSPNGSEKRVFVPECPSTGSIQVRIYTPFFQVDWVDIDEIQLAPTSQNVIEGQVYTSTNPDSRSSRVDDVLEVENGDNPSFKYYGTIVGEDQETPTTLWTREGHEDNVELLRILAENYMRMHQQVQMEFSGDFYGFLYPTNILAIDNLQNFIVTAYDFDTAENTISITAIQGYSAELLNLVFDLTTDYGNVVKPTIIG